MAQASSLCKRTGKMPAPPKCRAGIARRKMVGSAHPTWVNALEGFLIVIEKAADNYSAYCPGLPGCIATGKTIEEVKQRMGEAIKIHLAGMREDNIPIPAMKSQADYISLEL